MMQSISDVAQRLVLPDETPQPDYGECACGMCDGYGNIITPRGACFCAVKVKAVARERLMRVNLPARAEGMRFKNFVTDTQQRREVIERVVAYAKAFTPETRRGLLLHGAPGTGKTHLLVALVRHLVREGSRVDYWQHEALVQRIKDGFKRDGVTFNPTAQLTGDVLAIDDFGRARPSEWEVREIARLVDLCYCDEKPLLLTSNRSWIELARDWGTATSSRLSEMVEVIHAGAVDYRRKPKEGKIE